MKAIKYIWILSIVFFACNGNHDESDAYGNFEAKETIVSAESQGKIVEFSIEEGQQIKKDKIVGFIDTVALSIQRDQLYAQKQAVASKMINIKAQIDVQNEQKAVLKIELDRVDQLYKDNAATKQQYDDIKGKYDVLQKQIKATETQNTLIQKEVDVVSAQIKVVSDQIGRAYIVNPVKGTVLEKYLEEKEIAIPGKALYKIADLEYLELRAYVSGAQLANLELGQKLKVRVDKDSESNTEYEGELFWISDQAEFTPKIIQTKEERVNMVYAIKVRVKNDGKLKIGMPGEVKFN